MEAGIRLGRARVIRESNSGKALLIHIENLHNDKREGAWIPKACIHEDSEVYAPDGDNSFGELVVVERFAEEKGWS